MTSFTDLLNQSSSSAWLFIPSAIVFGALHGLEPGHSKTMMAAFIVAVRGTWVQAVLLALAATVSHTVIVWVIALLGLHYGKAWNLDAQEPKFQIASGAIIIALALWMLFQTWREQRKAKLAAQDHPHGHHHEDETKRINTGHGVVELSVFEDGVPPRFRLHYLGMNGGVIPPAAGQAVTVETVRPDGTRQFFNFTNRGEFLESTDEIPEPHEFSANLSIGHGDHVHTFELAYAEHGHDHGHDHAGLEPNSADYEDAHQRAHAAEIKSRFANRKVTTAQIVLFGLTGGLLPCPGAVTVLLVCLQLQRIGLGLVLVLCFSIGLAITLMASGILAAWGAKHVANRWKGFDTFTRRAPYFASLLIICVGLYMALQGIMAL